MRYFKCFPLLTAGSPLLLRAQVTAEEGFTADLEVFYCCVVFDHVSIYMKNCMHLLWSMVILFAHISREMT